MLALTSATPGRSAQMPRTLSLILTPARDAGRALDDSPSLSDHLRHDFRRRPLSTAPPHIDEFRNCLRSPVGAMPRGKPRGSE